MLLEDGGFSGSSELVSLSVLDLFSTSFKIISIYCVQQQRPAVLDSVTPSLLATVHSTLYSAHTASPVAKIQGTT